MTSGSLTAELEALEGALSRVAAADAAALVALRTELLGRKAGRLTHILKGLAALPPDQRREIGGRANRLKGDLETAIAARETELAGQGAAGPPVDPTMPARARWQGVRHPVSAVVDEICDIFRELGFTRVVGPEIETEAYNFTKLNISLDHPAADAQDTFYLPSGLLLRTHTSPMQARTMERFPPPIRIVVPGLAYRRDNVDASHLPVFEQIEGLVVDQGVSFVDFKAAIDFFVRRFFAPGTTVRFRPSFFPFVEPGAEVDVQCQVCRGSGCSTCKRSGYLEIMGAGMVHPAVFEACGVDAERYTGYAFGMGPERIAMLRHGIPDIRMLVEPDMRFLHQFSP
ncbi:MAG TPA: phenylalanine--tRNA ligase subunit alpha [Gemmatimonadales bacterium]